METKRSRLSVWIVGWLLLIALFIVGTLLMRDASANDKHRTFSIQSRGLVTYTDSTGTQHTVSPNSVQTEIVAEDF